MLAHFSVPMRAVVYTPGIAQYIIQHVLCNLGGIQEWGSVHICTCLW